MFSFYGSTVLGTLAASSPLSLLDVGARSGFHSNLEPLAPAIDAVGFEPDPEECSRLNAAAIRSPAPWKSQSFIPVALGKEEATRTLNLCRQPGCSSLLKPNMALIRQYQREADFAVERILPVATTTLDLAAERYGLCAPAFLKIDIQGAELEVLQSGETFLSTSVLGILSEVEFMPLYENQPLFSDLDRYLRKRGFIFVDFTFMRRWRHYREAEHLVAGSFPISRSRGTLAHADAFYLRDPEPLLKNPADNFHKLIWIALLSANYGFFDYASHLLQRPELQSLNREELNFDVLREFQLMQKKAWAFIHEKKRRKSLLQKLVSTFRAR